MEETKGLSEKQRAANITRYHQKRVYDALVALRLAIHEAKKAGAPVGDDLAAMDFEPMLKELKVLGGFIWNTDKSSRWYDGPDGTYEEPEAVEKELI